MGNEKNTIKLPFNVFLTDIALVPATMVSALFLGVRAFDAINDPLIGIMADRTKSRWGRYCPWMFFGAILLIPTITLLFWAHPDWSVARVPHICNPGNSSGCRNGKWFCDRSDLWYDP